MGNISASKMNENSVQCRTLSLSVTDVHRAVTTSSFIGLFLYRTLLRLDWGRARRLALCILLLALAVFQGFGCASPPCSLPAASLPARRRLPHAPSNSVDAASGWRSLAAVPQHSGPFPGGGSPGRSPRALPGYQMQGAPGSSPLP